MLIDAEHHGVFSQKIVALLANLAFEVLFGGKATYRSVDG